MNRHNFLFSCLLSILGAVPISGALAQCGTDSSTRETAVGIVYLDVNQNGVRDGGEAGIEGVNVSNGCDVTVTDVDGSYRIAISPTEILFVSQPSGYSVMVDNNNIPQFFYRHYPN